MPPLPVPRRPAILRRRPWRLSRVRPWVPRSRLDYRRETEDGQIVLAVSGVIVNTGSRQLPGPQTGRVTLSDASSHEIYHWSFKPNATVLAPGQSVPFVTRLASPPAAAAHLEVRFAKDGS